MGDEAVLEMQGEVGVATTEAVDEVILVGLDGAFCSVGAMKVQERVGNLHWNRAEMVLGRQGLKQFMRNSSVKFQLVPPHLHRTNAAERAIQTYKEWSIQEN